MSQTIWRSFSGFSFLFISLIFFLLSCSKERSVENPNNIPGGGTGGGGVVTGTAAFELVAAGNKCSDAALVGNFQAGTALSGSSKMTFTVKVTKAGTWAYSTAQVNGFLFAGTGE